MSKRSFTLTHIKGDKTKISENRFVSSTPASAAKKAFTRICRDKKISGVCSYQISMKETTRGSNEKVYKYDLKREKLKKPLIVQRGEVKIKIEFETKIKSVKN